MRIIFSTTVFIICIFFSVTTKAQGNAWNSSSFQLSNDIMPLENMAGATAAIFPGVSPRATDTIPFENGFKFRYGLTEYNRFSLSTYGWMKLGTNINSYFYSSEDDIIVPLSTNFTVFSCSYKITGTLGVRRFVAEWSGTLNAQATKFQVWLYEGSGRIDFVYQGNNSTGSTLYSVFCRTKVLGERAFAAVDIKVPPAAPVADYINFSSPISNNEAIPANTRISFQPNNTPPAPPSIQFSNVKPGCLTVNIKDNSNNESFFITERKDGVNYVLAKSSFSTSISGVNSLYSFNEINMKPDSLYTYRAFATNGFVNSDTVTATILTPLPLLAGLLKVPGDYPSINALLADAACKQMGPNLVIELQSNYSFAAEGGTVRFKTTLAHKLINSITIRPAATATALTIVNSGAYPIFTIDSVQNVHIDGRAGGLGTTSNLTLTETFAFQPTVAFINNANGGGVHYVKFNSNNNNPTYGLLFLGKKDPFVNGSFYQNGISNATINNCAFGPSSGVVTRCISIEGGKNNTITENEFFRFFNEAVYYNLGGENSRITKNRIYQPDQYTYNYGDGYNVASHKGVLSFVDVGNNFHIDSNKIGGAAAAWGIGAWKQELNYSNTGFGMIFIKPLPAEIKNKAFINNNEFGNINITGRSFSQIQVEGGSSSISGSRIGTQDSLASIVSGSFQIPIYVRTSFSSIIKNNFICGIKSNSDLSLINAFTVDSVEIYNNDIGGNDRYTSNSGITSVSGIGVLGVKNIDIHDNEVHGITSSTQSALGIDFSLTSVSPVLMYADIKRNKIHHISARRTSGGLYAFLGTVRNNFITNNDIYAIHGNGPYLSGGGSGYAPSSLFGISVIANESTFNIPARDTGRVVISRNKIYSFDYTTPSGPYGTVATGIIAEGINFGIDNNMISFGTKPNGSVSDSLVLGFTGIAISAAKRSYTEHNSIFISGNSSSKYGIILQGVNNASVKNTFVSNNIIQLQRPIGSSATNNFYISDIYAPINNVAANNNIWYSANDPEIATKIQIWKTNCGCDSAAIIADPKFVNPAGDSSLINLHVLAGSASEAAGTPSVLSLPVDFDNEVRNNYTPVDIGADAALPCVGAEGTSINISPGQEKIELCPGATLTVNATIAGNITDLRWQKNLHNIAGATAASYTITSPGSYRLTGMTPCGRISSQSIYVVTGVTAPIMKLVANNQSYICDSSPVDFVVEHYHFTLTNLQYKWYLNNVLVPGKITDHEAISGIHYGDRVSAEVINNTGCGVLTRKDSLYFYNVTYSYRPHIAITNFTDSIYNPVNSDTLHYTLTGQNNNYSPVVIYTSPIPGPLHSFLNDSTIVFSNIPYSFKFKLASFTPLGASCYFADTTSERTIYYSNTPIPKTYTFNGSGEWTNAANWINAEIPPSPVPFNATVLIMGTGPCIVHGQLNLGIGAHLTVVPGSFLQIVP